MPKISLVFGKVVQIGKSPNRRALLPMQKSLFWRFTYTQYE